MYADKFRIVQASFEAIRAAFESKRITSFSRIYYRRRCPLHPRLRLINSITQILSATSLRAMISIQRWPRSRPQCTRSSWPSLHGANARRKNAHQKEAKAPLLKRDQSVLVVSISYQAHTRAGDT